MTEPITTDERTFTTADFDRNHLRAAIIEFAAAEADELGSIVSLDGQVCVVDSEELAALIGGLPLPLAFCPEGNIWL